MLLCQSLGMEQLDMKKRLNRLAEKQALMQKGEIALFEDGDEDDVIEIQPSESKGRMCVRF